MPASSVSPTEFRYMLFSARAGRALIVVTLLLASAALLAATGSLFARPSFADDGPPGEVWVDAANGDDDNNGSEAAPFATIETAVGAVADGGIVNVESAFTPRT